MPNATYLHVSLNTQIYTAVTGDQNKVHSTLLQRHCKVVKKRDYKNVVATLFYLPAPAEDKPIALK